MAMKLVEHLVIDHLKPFGEEEIAQYPGLRAIATRSTGTDHIDLNACEAAGIKVYSLMDDRDALSEIRASSEWTFFLILAALRRADHIFRLPYRQPPGRELFRKNVGIVGMGRIGENIARWCAAFEADTCWRDPYKAGYSVSLDIIFSTCDIIVICCSLTKETKHMIGEDLLRLCKQNAIIINTARGAVVNESHLLRFLHDRPDVTVCMDVHEHELEGKPNPFLGMPNVIVSNHEAGNCIESNAKAKKIAEGLLSRNEDV